jgi:putative membrane protein
MKRYAVIAGCVGALAAYIAAPAMVGDGRMGFSAQAAGDRAGTKTDATSAKTFATKAAMSDLFEIQTSRLALTKSDDDDIKSFAQKMIDAHSDSTTKLKGVLKDENIGVTPPTTLDQEHEAKLKRLEGLSGSAFDREYAKMQQDGHTKALSLLRTYNEQGDNPALKQFAQDTIPIVQGHLRQAQALP